MPLCFSVSKSAMLVRFDLRCNNRLLSERWIMLNHFSRGLGRLPSSCPDSNSAGIVDIWRSNNWVWASHKQLLMCNLRTSANNSRCSSRELSRVPPNWSHQQLWLVVQPISRRTCREWGNTLLAGMDKHQLFQVGVDPLDSIHAQHLGWCKKHQGCS